MTNFLTLCSYEEANVTTIIDMMHYEKVVMMHNVNINNFAIWVYRNRFNHRTSKYPFAYYPSLFFTKQRHPFNSLLKLFVFNFHSAGFATRLEEKYKLGHKLCESCEDDPAIPLTVIQLSSCWFLLFIGLFASLTILLTELFFHKVTCYCKLN